MTKQQLYRELTNARNYGGALFLIVIGILALVTATNWSWLIARPNIQAIVRDIGAFLVATGPLEFVREISTKRAFAAEMLGYAKVAEDVRAAGLMAVTSDFQQGIDWGRLFKNVREVDIFFSYAGTWRHSRINELESLAARKGCQLRVVMPDPDDALMMADLARRFGYTEDGIKQRINDSADDLKKIFAPQAGRNKGCRFELWYLTTPIVFSFYRFDDDIVLALYKHRKGRGSVPAFIVEKGGTLYNFVKTEIDACFLGQNSIAKRVYSNRE